MANNLDYDTRGLVVIRGLPVKSGATFKKGNFLIWTATGGDGPPTAGTNYAPTSDTTRIAGKALSDSTVDGVALTHVDVEIAQPGTEFPIPIYHATPASAVPALSLLGKQYELRNSTAVGGVSIPQIDIATTTNKTVAIVDFVKGDTPAWPDSVTGGAQYALAWVEFVAAACQFTGAR